MFHTRFWLRIFLGLLIFIFVALAFYLFNHPQKEFLELFVCFIPIILLTSLFQKLSGEIYRWDLVLFFTFSVLELLHGRNFKGIDIALLFSYWLCALLALIIAGRLYEKVNDELIRCKEKILEIETGLKTVSQENSSYFSHISTLKDQIGTRQKLSAFTREMGTLLDPDKIKEKLLGKVQSLFPSGQISLRTALTDPVDQWVTEKKMPVLVKDIASDSRFKDHLDGPESAQAVIAAPLVFERNLLGLIRVDSQSRHQFNETDLQQLELYTYLSTLALGNAHLFAKVTEMATRDGLTGLATHRIFQEKLSDELLRSARYHTNLGLVMVDIDHFKGVNDRYGHLVGDQVLKEVSDILKSACRDVDFPARYGGEEFVLIFPELSFEQLYQLAEKLRTDISNRSIITPQHILNVTVSIGCSLFPSDAQTANQLIRTADERLYKAKKQGRNQVVIN